jgi:hypothetical protein
MTLIMVRQEHIHIITAGTAIYESFAVTVRDHQDITHTFVFADTELYTNNPRDEPEVRAQKETARDAVTKVKTLAASLKIPASLVYVIPPADTSARDSILKIKKEYPDAKFSFDLSAGSKEMCLALFALSLWVEEGAYYTFGDGEKEPVVAKLAVPKISVESIAVNSNFLKILQTLYRSPRVLPRSYLFNQLAGFYVPVRKKGVKVVENKTGKTDLNTGKKAELHELSQGTFSNILRTMTALDLVQEMAGPDNNRKEISYAITSCGELALQLAEIKPLKP